MKIVLATPLYPPEIGGPATYAKLLVEELPKRGIEVELVKFSEVRHLPKFVRHFAYRRRVLRAVRGADLVFALDPVSTGVPALSAAKAAGKPFIVKIVGDYAWEQGSQRFGVTASLDEFVRQKRVPWRVALLRRAEVRVARGAARVIVPSNYLRQILFAWGVSLDKVKIIYNAVELTPGGSVPDMVAVLPRPLVVTAGRLVPWKHFDEVIKATSAAHASLAIVGDGPLRSNLTSQIEQEMGKRGVMTSSLSHADTLATMKAADVFVLNSTYEGFSHALVEALSLGKAIIATAIGGNEEIIDRQNGILVPVHNTPALTKAIGHITSDPEFKSQLEARATDSALRFTKEKMIEETIALFTSI